ncbi:MAG TPA: GNAT family protein [Lysobacter sp.]
MRIDLIHTARLTLLPASPEDVQAALAGPEALAAQLQAAVPADWPHEYLDEAALRLFHEHADSDSGRRGWWLRFILLREDNGNRRLIGSTGYKGPPDADNSVEIGYGIVAGARRQGYATEAARGLVRSAFQLPEVSTVVASTLPYLVESIGVLCRSGFRQVGGSQDGRIVRYALSREHAVALGYARSAA